MEIRDYTSADETGWVRCRVLAFLQTAYFDDVRTKKEQYENPAIELVAEKDGQIVGLIDVEYEIKTNTVCSRKSGLGGMIWNIAVHPDFSRAGIGSRLLYEAEKRAQQLQLTYFEAWTRDDPWVQQWYEKQTFIKTDAYYQIYFGQKMMNELITPQDKLYPLSGFAHYTGNEIEKFMKDENRIHECACYHKVFDDVLNNS